MSLPNLTEITDHLLLYRADQVRDLSTLLPKLAVIRGNKLTGNYALVIYRMKNMLTISLPSLTSIIRGGVRIEKNPQLCYINTVDWASVVMEPPDPTTGKKLLDIRENQEVNVCSDTCPSACQNPDTCWDDATCQRRLVNCPHGTEWDGMGDASGEKKC